MTNQIQSSESSGEGAASHLVSWAQQNPSEARSLQIPDEFASLLIPKRVYEVADKPANVEVKIERVGKNTLTVSAVERASTRQLTDITAWNNWNRKIEEARAAHGGRMNTIGFIAPRPPENVNRLHAEFRQKILGGALSISDRILFTCTLRFGEETHEVLQVSDFDGETQTGIGTDFYQNSLPPLARALGFRFVTGQQNDNNLSFFTKKLGRSTYNDLKEEVRATIFPGYSENSGIGAIPTIQFLYPEDRASYLKDTNS